MIKILKIDFFLQKNTQNTIYVPLAISLLTLFITVYILNRDAVDFDIKNHGLIALGVSFICIYLSYIRVKKSILKNYNLACMAQENLNTIELIKNDFEEPKKFIEKSFDKQKQHIIGLRKLTDDIVEHINSSEQEVHQCEKTVQESESMLENGNMVMIKLKNSIETIKQATKDMEMTLKIINEINIKSSVITDIVSKTELLAMNASIEAARAGDYGKGFSVVSEEVGQLARNSGNSAKKIKDLLNESSIKVSQVLRVTDERIKDGEQVSKMVIHSFDSIHNGINALKEQNNIILHATEKQKESIMKIFDSFKTIEIKTEENYSNLKESSEIIDRIQNNNQEFHSTMEEIHKKIAGVKSAQNLKNHRNNKLFRLIKLDQFKE